MDFRHILDHLRSNQTLIYQAKMAILRLYGPDAKSFIQRLSTNDLNKLHHKEPLQSSFLNNKGRLVDHAWVFANKDDKELILLSSHEDGSILFNFLERFHFVEDFVIEQVNNKYKAYIFISSDKDLTKLKLIFSLDKKEIDHLLEIDDEQWQTLRIAAKLATAPQEICDSFMPQEVGLTDYIAHDKGCYLGQEVIAKAFSYQKNKRYLVGLMLSKKEYEEAKTTKIPGLSSLSPIYVPGLINALAIPNK